MTKQKKQRLSDARYWVELFLDAIRRFLRIGNYETNPRSLLDKIAIELRNISGCEGVAIRLLDQDFNIPYFAFDGLSLDFITRENNLCIKDDLCLCNKIMRGECNCTFPGSTINGSFHTGSTTDFINSFPEEVRGPNRRACNDFGFESLALIPITVGGGNIGLIQVVDSRENQISAEMVEMFENISLILGPTIQSVRAATELQQYRNLLASLVDSYTEDPDSKYKNILQIIEGSKRIEEQLQEREASYRFLFQNIGMAFAHGEIITGEHNLPEDFILLEINEEFAHLIGLNETETLGKRGKEVFTPITEEYFSWIDIFGNVALSGGSLKTEKYISSIDRWYYLLIYSPNDRQFAVIFDDITEKKRAEQEIHQNNQRLTIINQILNAAIQETTLDAFLATTFHAVLAFLEYDRGGIYLVNADNETAELRYSYGLDADFYEQVKLVHIHEEPFIHLFIEGRPSIYEDYETEGKLEYKANLGSARSFPILNDTGIIGAINVASQKRTKFLDEEKNLFEIIGKALGTALSHFRLPYS